MMVDFLVTNPFLSRETENVVDPDVFVLPALARNFPLNVCEVSTAGDSAFSAFHFWHRTLALGVRTVLKRRVPGNNWFPAAGRVPWVIHASVLEVTLSLTSF